MVLAKQLQPHERLPTLPTNQTKNYAMTRFCTRCLLLSMLTVANGNDAIQQVMNACVFGGSTSTGGGHPVTPPGLIWHAKAAKTFTNITGVLMQISNFARGATDADFYSTCFDRFEPSRCDLVMLEFSINGGNVEELVTVAHRKSRAPVVLVTQYSCNAASDGNEEAVQRGPHLEEYRAIARKHHLLGIHMDVWTSFRYGNPCENATRHILFKEDAHHLSDTGHAVLGELVGRRLAEAYPYLLHKHRHHDRMALRHADEDIFCAASGEMLGSPQHDLATTFQSDGWTYDTDVPGRPDKACWLTTQPEATLTSVQEFDSFSRVDMFAQFSNKLQGVVRVGCDGGDIGRVNTTWLNPWTVIHRHKFRHNDSSFKCAGRLRIVATNVGGTAETPVETKVCGVVVKT